jgi:IS30 family transposase
MAHYQQLSIEEREQIHVGLWAGKSLREIARRLHRPPSTVSRELKRNIPGERRYYVPRLAHQRAAHRIQTRGHRPRLKQAVIRAYVIRTMKEEDYSPEQIAGTLPSVHPGHSISPEAIYQFVYAQYRRQGFGACIGEDLRMCLKRKHKVRHPKLVPFQEASGRIKNRVFIDDRPVEVDARIATGHWEGDSMVSRQSLVGLNTLVERVTGLVLITKISNTTAKETARVVTERLKVLPKQLRKTMTVDNGHENAHHEQITRDLKMNIYFAHPYHSWERGTNENTNGLIRWYLPKRTDFATISDERIHEIEYRLNTRPRKRLGWRTPLEIFNQRVALEGGM